MKDENKILSRINNLIGRDKDVTITKAITKNGKYFSGNIEVSYLGETLEFEISIPHHYPLTHPNSDNISIIFRNKDYIGLDHINPDGSVCFHPDKDDNFDRKLLYELKCLKQWIRNYYISKKEDENYAYLVHSTESTRIDKLYFTNTKNNFKKDSFGVFNYSVFSDEKFGKKKFPVKKLFRLGFDDGEQDTWSKSFANDLITNTCKKGVYYFIEEEPLKKKTIGRKAIEYWEEFEDYFSDKFLEYLCKGIKRGFGKSYFHENNLFMIIGYKIPNDQSYEEHWDLIRIPKNRIPIDYQRLSKGVEKRFFYDLKKIKINWGGTENIDYSRFFGRGKLNEQITNSNIFLVGCGALGSSLAEILVRGGVKNLVLEDFDNIRGGNLCRANYDLKNLIYFKTDCLTKRLKSISPFVNLRLESQKLNNYELEVIAEYFNKHIDIIFDCSTDPEVTYILDKIDFKGTVFSLAITNNAKSFVSITGKKLTKQAKVIFDYIENEPPTYFEGAGCGYPTFEANYNDINALLNLGLKSINHNFSNSISNKTLTITPTFKGQKTISIEEYEYYNLNTINSSIHIPISILKEIEQIIKHHYPKEFGGVFVGYKSGENFIITDILMPDEYKNGKTVFIRHPGTLNQRLDKLHKTTGGKVQYLGEWHSHPDGPTSPSRTDLKAMKDISKDKMINIDNPLLMIVEVNKSFFNNDLYIFHDKKLKRYE